jgi:SNW domain-containing protein 1
MAGLLSCLPAPKHAPAPFAIYEEEPDEDTDVVVVAPYPPYGKRRGWTPSSELDFGDGGAFPEIHVLQHPLGMGKRDQGTTAVALTTDADGRVKFDAIVKRGHNVGKVIHSSLDDMKPHDITDGLEKPSAEDMKKNAEKTKAALNMIVDRQIAAACPTHVTKTSKEPTFIRYTPNQQGEAYNSGAKQRMIRLQEMPVDPFEPPKFKHKKLPNGPPSPPVPVMHSPPRKITVADQQNWKIPPCVSHWKNIKGYTIPLHHRLAADGRGLQQVTINPKFESLSQGLYLAERTARQETRERANLRKQVDLKKKEYKESQLFKMAQEARQNISVQGDQEREEEEYMETEQATCAYMDA